MASAELPHLAALSPRLPASASTSTLTSPDTTTTTTTNNDSTKRPLGAFVKFVASEADGLPVKRRQVQRACSSCRKRKKRCVHGSNAPDRNTDISAPPTHTPSAPSCPQRQRSRIPHKPPQRHSSRSRATWGVVQREEDPISTPTPTPTSAQATTPSSSQPLRQKDQLSTPSFSPAELGASQLVELSTSAFVGDLAPESVFIHAANESLAGFSTPSLREKRSGLGTWVRRQSSPGNNFHDAEPPLESATITGSPEQVGGSRRFSRTSNSGVLPPVSKVPSRRQEQPRFHPLQGLLLTQSPDERMATIEQYLAVCPPAAAYEHLHRIYAERIHPILPILNDSDLLAIHDPSTCSTPRSNRLIVFRQAICLAASLDPLARPHLHLTTTNDPPLQPQDFHNRLSAAILTSVNTDVLTDRVDHIRVLLLLFLFYQPRHASERDTSPLIFSQAVHYAHTLGIHVRGFGRDTGGGDDDSGEAEVLFLVLWALDGVSAAFYGRPCIVHERDTDLDLDACIERQGKARPAFKLFLRLSQKLQEVICLYRPRAEGLAGVEMPVFETMILDAGADKMASTLLATLEVFYHAITILSCRKCPKVATTSRGISSAHLPDPDANARRSLSADRIIDSVVAAISPSRGPSSDGICVLPFVPYGVALSLSVTYLKMRSTKIPMYRSRAKARFGEVVGLLQSLGEVYACARFNAGLGMAILQEMDKTAKGLVSSNGANGGCGNDSQQIEDRQNDQVGYEKAAVSQPGVCVPAKGPNTESLAQLDTLSGNDQIHFDGAETGVLPAWSDMSDVDLFMHFDPEFDLNAVDAALGANLEMGVPQAWTMQYLGK